MNDAPIATVKTAGLSEAVLLLTALGGLLSAVFGQDWGMQANAQEIASGAFVVAPAVLGVIRALKHRGAQHANAVVYAAQAAAAPAPAVEPAVPSQTGPSDL